MTSMLLAITLALLAAATTFATPTPPAYADDSLSSVAVNYKEPPLHIRPVRQHNDDTDYIGEGALAARRPTPPDSSLSGVGHRPGDLLATDVLSVYRDSACLPMTRKSAALCSRFNYNMTRMPNLLNHETQVEAYQQLSGYSTLVASNCSENLQFLLCSYHLPSCQAPGTLRTQQSTGSDSAGGVSTVALVTPCRGLCERVRDSCVDLMQRYGYDWPHNLQCDRLQREEYMIEPQSGEAVACVNQAPAPRPNAVAITTVEPHVPCEPRACPSQKMKRKTFKANRYDWVIEGRYLGMIVKSRNHSLQIRVESVLYKNSNAPRRLKAGRDLIILTDQDESVCGPCPPMTVMDFTYILAGHAQGSRLIYNVDSGIASRTKPSYASKVAKWVKKLYKS